MVKMDKIDKECMFCKHKDIDETKYGPMYKLNDVVVHYFCIVSTLWIILYNSNFWNLNVYLIVFKIIKNKCKRQLSCFQLLSTLAIQNGTDFEGIWGFLIEDIKIELKRGSTQVDIFLYFTEHTWNNHNFVFRFVVTVKKLELLFLAVTNNVGKFFIFLVDWKTGLCISFFRHLSMQ